MDERQPKRTGPAREPHVRELDRAVADLRSSEDQLRRRNEELEVLNGLLLRAGGPMRLSDLLDALLSAALRVAGPNASGGIFLLDDARRELRLSAHRGVDDTFVARERTVRLGECLCGQAALTGEVIVAGADDPRHTRPTNREPHGHAIIPLSSHEQVLGVLFINLPTGQTPPTAERERLFRLMGRQIGISIENAQLYQRTDAELQRESLELGGLLRDLSARAFTADERARLRHGNPIPQLRLAGDRSWLERALVNVIGNALKYAPGDSPVRVSLAAEGDQALVTVTDEGPGIPAEELPQIFQRFFRASNTRRRVEGSGLGLFIARKVVEGHGGEATVQSELGRGTTIRFRLPLLVS